MSVPAGIGADVDAVAAALAAGRPVDEVLDLVDGAVERGSEAGDGASLARLAALLDDAATGRSDARGLAIASARARAAAIAAARARAAPTSAAGAEALPANREDAGTAVLEAPAEPAAGPSPALRYSGWWRRALAFTLDWIVLFTAIGLVAPESDGAAALALIVLPYAYFVILHALSRGQTLGKAVFGIAVRRADGGLIGLSSALVRSMVQGLLWITLIGGIVDSLLPLGDARRRSLHDRAASTVVVRVR